MSNHRPNSPEPPLPDPIAYFLTWTTYGSWLPGDERGWVLRGRGFRIPDPVRQERAAALMTETACFLTRDQRAIVEQTIVKHCTIREWLLHAVSSRTNHVHVVVSAHREPDEVREQLKPWCTRKSKEDVRSNDSAGDPAAVRRNWWTERGSMRCVGDEESLEAVVLYVRDAQ